MHPYINRPAKGALRWYNDPTQITRYSRACKEHSELCPFALDWPAWQILPFQFASFDGPFSATTWGLYDLNGILAYDLSAYIEMLTVEVVTSPGPERRVISSDAPILLDFLLAAGLYEMRITAVGGYTYWSETIRVICGPCMVVDGVYGDDALEEGNRYAYTEGRVATYCGLDCENPVDENGFNTFDACSGGTVLVVNQSKWGEYTWNSTEWLASFEMPCYHKLEWRHCGDVGTQLYKDNGYSNIVYLKEADAPISEPAVVWAEEREKDVNGGEAVSQARKDVEWTLKTTMAWFLFDAITETPLLGDVRLRAAYSGGVDSLKNIRFEYQWDGTCQISVAMTFRCGDDSSSTACCDKFEREDQPVDPCVDCLDVSNEAFCVSFGAGGGSVAFGITGDYVTFYPFENPDDKDIVLIESGEPIPFDAGESLCAYPSDGSGEPSSLLEVIAFVGVSSITMNTLVNSSNLSITSSPELTPASIDSVANALDPTFVASGDVTVDGSIPLPTSASQTNRQACYDTGWTLPASWLTDLDV